MAREHGQKPGHSGICAVGLLGRLGVAVKGGGARGEERSERGPVEARVGLSQLLKTSPREVEDRLRVSRMRGMWDESQGKVEGETERERRRAFARVRRLLASASRSAASRGAKMRLATPRFVGSWPPRWTLRAWS